MTGQRFSKAYKGETWIFQGGINWKNFKSYFWPEQFYNIGPEYNKRCIIATFYFFLGGGMFPKKSWFSQYFNEIIMISGFWDYNGAIGDNQTEWYLTKLLIKGRVPLLFVEVVNLHYKHWFEILIVHTFWFVCSCFF